HVSCILPDASRRMQFGPARGRAPPRTLVCSWQTLAPSAAQRHVPCILPADEPEPHPVGARLRRRRRPPSPELQMPDRKRQRDAFARRSSREETSYGPDPLAAGHVRARPGDDGPHVRLRDRLREGVKGTVMIILAAVVTVLLFIYLLAALLRPEWF